MSEIQSNLIPGSVWSRAKKNNEVSNSTVICVTNENCSERVIEANPHQVVFMTEQLQILSMTIENFLKGRVYVGIDADVAATVQFLTTEQEDDELGDDIDLDSIEIDENAFQELVGQQVETDDNDIVEDTVSEQSEFRVLGLNVGPHPISSDLESSFVGYSEVPYHTGDTMHGLRFSLNGTLSLNNISQAFLLSDPNAIQTFEIATKYEVIKIEVSAYVDTLFESSLTEGDVAVVYLLTEGNFRDLVVDDTSSDVVELEAEVIETNNNQIQVSVS